MHGNKRYVLIHHRIFSVLRHIINLTYTVAVNSNRFIVISDQYIKVYNSNCDSKKGFGTLPEAKYACSSLKNCVGILDEGCKEDYEYYLCLDFYEEDKDKLSCIHKKRNKKGT